MSGWFAHLVHQGAHDDRPGVVAARHHAFARGAAAVQHLDGAVFILSHTTPEVLESRPPPGRPRSSALHQVAACSRSGRRRWRRGKWRVGESVADTAACMPPCDMMVLAVAHAQLGGDQRFSIAVPAWRPCGAAAGAAAADDEEIGLVVGLGPCPSARCAARNGTPADRPLRWSASRRGWGRPGQRACSGLRIVRVIFGEHVLRALPHSSAGWLGLAARGPDRAGAGGSSPPRSRPAKIVRIHVSLPGNCLLLAADDCP